MLIKDPYLESQRKDIEMQSQPQVIPENNTSALSQPVYSDVPRNRAFSGGQMYELKGRVKAYQKQLRNMETAYVKQEEATRKMMNFYEVNRNYHEAMKNRNYELNTKLRDFANEVQLAHHRSQEDYVRYAHDKDVMLKKYQEQADQVLRLRANCNAFIEQKTRLEQEVSNLSFIIEKERHQNELDIKQCSFRMESMERTYKGLISAKEEQISQLVNRLRLYEDENRKLTDINRTLQLTKDNRVDKIDNLSQIHHLQSNIKSRDKQNEDMNIQRSHLKENIELKEQKTINDELRREMEKMKNQINDLNAKNGRLEKEAKSHTKPKEMDSNELIETSKWKGIMASVNSLREGINKEIFQLFFKSVRDGERKKQNSLVIFIENWKSLNMEKLQPFIRSYFEARTNLKAIASSKQTLESVHLAQMEEVIPLKVGSRPGRSQINQWILSTIQFTKNQKDSGKKCLNNFLLFVFRLLTIQYRIKYPMQGKSYTIDQDVTNELMHQIIKGIELIFKYQ